MDSSFRWKTKSGFWACAITFQTCSNTLTISDVSNWYYGSFGRPRYFQYNRQKHTRRAGSQMCYWTNYFLLTALHSLTTMSIQTNVTNIKPLMNTDKLLVTVRRHYTIGVNTKGNGNLEGCLTVHLPHEIMWNAILMQQGNFIDVFLARHVSST